MAEGTVIGGNAPQTNAPLVTTTIEDDVAWIRMDDGKVNAMSLAMLTEVDAAVHAAQSQAKVVVLAGREGIFSAGFDMPTFKRPLPEIIDMLLAGARLIESLLALPRPVLAVCTGHAYPMGAFLLMASDVRIATDGPWRIGMNETAIGLTVPHFALEIARHRLTPAAFASIGAATMFAPRDAVAAGYVDRVTEPCDLEQSVRDEAQRLTTLDPAAFEGTKLRLNEEAIRRVREAALAEFGPQ